MSLMTLAVTTETNPVSTAPTSRLLRLLQFLHRPTLLLQSLQIAFIFRWLQSLAYSEIPNILKSYGSTFLPVTWIVS